MDLKTLLKLPKLAKQAIQFFINTRLLLQLSYANLFSIEKNIFNINTKKTKIENI